MDSSDNVYNRYTDQMQQLEQFRNTYQSIYSTHALEQDDPEVKRLTEALAYFTAYTQELSKQRIDEMHMHMGQQLHPYLLSPIPAQSILHLNPKKLNSTETLQQNTSVYLEAEDNTSALFKTVQPVRLLPILCTSLDIEKTTPTDTSFRLSFKADQEMTTAPEHLPLYINMDHHFERSIGLLYQLKEAVETMYVCYDNNPQNIYNIQLFQPERPTFGLNPIEYLRHQFHFPFSQSFLYLKLAHAPAKWNAFSIHFKLKKSVIEKRLTKECFKLFCTPIINLREEATKDFFVDGTKSSYTIHQPELDDKLALHSVKSVYYKQGKRYFPLHISSIRSGENTYALSDIHGTEPTLDIHMPHAFTDPKVVSADARWYQPEFGKSFWQRITVSSYDVEIAGVDWELTSERQPHLNHSETDATFSLKEILSLHTGDQVSPRYLRQLFYVLSSQCASEFKPIISAFTEIVSMSEDSHFQLRFNGIKQTDARLTLFVSLFQNFINEWFESKNYHLTTLCTEKMD